MLTAIKRTLLENERKMKQLLLTLFIICLFSSAGFSQLKYGQKRIIFGKDVRVNLRGIKDTTYPRFTPYFDDIDSTDTFLNKNFNPDFNFSGKILLFENYYRQYFGVLINGKRCIYIKGFCNESECFMQSYCDYMGGGTCYFRILIEIDTKKILLSYFNAPK